ncbi:MAG: TerB family tellurite resistance protein [Frankia sp.]
MSAVLVDVRLVGLAGGRILLARPSGRADYVLPGGPVEHDEGADRALVRHLADAETSEGAGLGALPIGPEFVGVVEHRDTPAGPSTLTVLFAVVWPPGADLPTRWRGDPLTAVDLALLIATPLVPVPIARAVQRWLAERWPLWLGIPGTTEAQWKWQRPAVASLRAQLADRLHLLRGGGFRDAAVAMCALVTAADGRIDPAERDGVRAFVTTDQVLAHFSATELEALFDDHLNRLMADFPAGQAAALTEIAKVRGKPAEAHAVVRIGEVIGRVDGEFPPSEQAAVRAAIDVLGLDPAEFSLAPPAGGQPTADGQPAPDAARPGGRS